MGKTGCQHAIVGQEPLIVTLCGAVTFPAFSGTHSHGMKVVIPIHMLSTIGILVC